MRKIVNLDGKKAILDTESDDCIYLAPRGLDPARRQGTDIFLHVTKGGKKIFYKYVWTLYEHDVDYIDVISEEEARKILEENSQWLTDEDITLLKQVFPDFFEETA